MVNEPDAALLGACGRGNKMAFYQVLASVGAMRLAHARARQNWPSARRFLPGLQP